LGVGCSICIRTGSSAVSTATTTGASWCHNECCVVLQHEIAGVAVDQLPSWCVRR
jgi:hypothetical protein